MRNLIIKRKVQTSNGNVNGEPTKGWFFSLGQDYSVLAKIYIQCNKQEIYIYIGIEYFDIGLNMS